MKDSEIAQYLERIKLDDCATSFEGLTQLQNHHTENIPFENLDILVRREIPLDYEHLFDKIVTNKRGGYCFELNTLYAELLKSFGFAPKPILGRVWLSNPISTPPRNHMSLLLDLDGKTYVTDVGFGGLVTRIPLDIHDSTPMNDTDGMVRVIPYVDHQFMIQRETEKGWMDLYSFENIAISQQDVEISNYYMATHPKSHFFKHKIASKNTPNGRIALFNNKLTIRKGIKIVNRTLIHDGQDWLQTVEKEFDMKLDYNEEELNILFTKR